MDKSTSSGFSPFIREDVELYLAIASGVSWLLGLLFLALPQVATWGSKACFLAGMLFGGFFTVQTAFLSLRQGRFDIDFLMLVAAVGAAALDKWQEGALLLFLFSLGHALEQYAMGRARKSITALADLAPRLALRREGAKIVEVGVEELEPGDVIVVRPNTKIAADGLVIKGKSTVDQAPITGESIPVDKEAIAAPDQTYEWAQVPAEHRVFAGTINGSSVLEVRVLRRAQDSTLARLVELVQEAESQKSPTQHLADKFERVYVPAVLGVVGVLLFAFLIIDETFSDSFYRAMSVLVAASPCALALSTPSAVLAGVARAARQGVLIKGGRPLEDMGQLTAMAFDKTGTLTEGKPKLTEVIVYGQHTEQELLATAVAVEQLSDHPLAAAIVAGGLERIQNTSLVPASQLEALTARGVRATLNGEIVHIGNRRLLEEVTGAPIPRSIDEQMAKLEAQGQTVMIVHRADRYLGLIAVMDVARAEARTTLQQLRQLGIKRLVMLTGDNQQVARAVATSIGIAEVLGNLLPEDKVASIEQLKTEEGRVAMVGDGVNDAPAMAKSTVSIAMGAAGSELALETADIALMGDQLNRLPFVIGLSRQARRIIKQNLAISLGMVAILVPLTLVGIAKLGPAVIAHEGSTLVVVLNALRLLGYQQKSARGAEPQAGE
ncbi:MAG: heavy metal translocating P-type ATPase [Bacteroidetes bacterium]|nr:MAG: heavy metal translocating P-type ATPase [Bacteroidota bacterium]